MGKDRVREIIQEFSKGKRAERSEERERILRDWERITRSPVITEQQAQIRLLKLRFGAGEALEMGGTFVRSRAEYLEKGERSNK